MVFQLDDVYQDRTISLDNGSLFLLVSFDRDAFVVKLSEIH